MKAVKHTGLVPVKALVSDSNFRAGAVFGIQPSRVAEAVAKGQVALVPIPSTVETIEVGGPEPQPPVAAASTASAAPEKKSDVVIPEDWDQLHYLQKVKLAQAILGVEKLVPPQDVKPAAYAVEVIIAELEKRGIPYKAAAVQSDEDKAKAAAVAAAGQTAGTAGEAAVVDPAAAVNPGAAGEQPASAGEKPAT